jgi:hypothetical protein
LLSGEIRGVCEAKVQVEAVLSGIWVGRQLLLLRLLLLLLLLLRLL